MKREAKSRMECTAARHKAGSGVSACEEVSPHASRGFTLLEILVALLVISLGMFAAVKASGSYAANLNYLQERTFAHWVARNALNELQLEDSISVSGSKEDETRFADRDWTWKAGFEKTPDPDIVRVKVEVWSGRDDAGESLASLVGYVKKQ